MVNKPKSSIYTIVEKAYFRLQAGDVLTRCLEDGSMDPLREMIQEMVIAGPQSLEAIREILGETVKRKSQVHDDLSQVTNQLGIILKGYGISLEKQGGNQVLMSLTEQKLLEIMDEQDITESESRSSSVLVLRDSHDLISTLNIKIGMLENIETYLQDWLLGLTYQHIRHGDHDLGENTTKVDLQ